MTANFSKQSHNKKIFYLENEGQGHGVQHTMQILASIKAILEHFFASSHSFRDSHFKIHDIENVGKDRDVQYS